MKTTRKISDAIEHELLGWSGVTAGTHRPGGREFRVRHREVGHLHVADAPFGRQILDELAANCPQEVFPARHSARAASFAGAAWPFEDIFSKADFNSDSFTGFGR